MFCDYEVDPIASGGFCHLCRLCGDVRIKPVARYRRQCPMAATAASTPQLPSDDVDVAAKSAIPSLGRRLMNFSKAAIAHALAGAPTCSDEEIASRHAVCQACELYRPDPNRSGMGTCAHATCGCEIHRETWYVSKLAWADQSCPLGKWGELGAKPAGP
jgi:hypothetical protein